MNPKTQEYLEAEQVTANNIKKSILEELSEEDKQKFKIVEEAVETLTKNNINFHLYALLPNSLYNNKEVIWQYNSLTALAKFDESGKITKETNNRISHFCAGMLTCIFNDITSFKLGKNASMKERWDCFGEYLSNCLGQYYNFLNKNKTEIKKDE